jgi:hypothetical protein
MIHYTFRTCEVTDLGRLLPLVVSHKSRTEGEVVQNRVYPAKMLCRQVKLLCGKTGLLLFETTYSTPVVLRQKKEEEGRISALEKHRTEGIKFQYYCH